MGYKLKLLGQNTTTRNEPLHSTTAYIHVTFHPGLKLQGALSRTAAVRATGELRLLEK